LLPVVKTLAEAQDWSVTVDRTCGDGVRIVIKN
jgi:hypothetical protein